MTKPKRKRLSPAFVRLRAEANRLAGECIRLRAENDDLKRSIRDHQEHEHQCWVRTTKAEVDAECLRKDRDAARAAVARWLGVDVPK